MRIIVSLILMAGLIILPDVYIYIRFLHSAPLADALLVNALPLVATTVCALMAALGIGRRKALHLFYILFSAVSLPKALFAVISVWGLLLPPAASEALVAAGLVVAVAVSVAFLYGFIFGWRHVVVRQEEFRSQEVPQQFDGYRIVQFSDLHIGSIDGDHRFLEDVVAKINAQEPDLIAFTGDLVNSSAEEVLPFIGTLGKLKASDGVFSILGNHDYCQDSPRSTVSDILGNIRALLHAEEEMQWRVLRNESVVIRRGDSSLSVIGVENISEPPFPTQGDLKKAMRGLPQEPCFKVLLSHDPKHWRKEVLHGTDIHITLSGHTHAGQIKIGHFSPAHWAYNEWGGSYMEDGRMLNVSLGLGGRVPFRLGAWPEINVITLVKA